MTQRIPRRGGIDMRQQGIRVDSSRRCPGGGTSACGHARRFMDVNEGHCETKGPRPVQSTSCADIAGGIPRRFKPTHAN